MHYYPIITAKELIEILNQENLVIVNAGSGGLTYDDYVQNHIKNSLYVDLNKDLAQVSENPKSGGRHPLPSLERFSALLQKLGINENSQVIIYDNKNSTNAAPRFWWMLRAVGIKNVQVLDGGFPNPLSVDLHTEKGLSKAGSLNTKDKFSSKEWDLPLVDINYIKENADKPDILVLDVREKDRYNGKFEPIDEVAGHIPGAVNIPFQDNYDQNGKLLPPEILKDKYQKVFKNIKPENISIHCGSGVTACNTILALDYAGLEIPNLYVGSWSEWSRSGNEIATNL